MNVSFTDYEESKFTVTAMLGLRTPKEEFQK